MENLKKTTKTSPPEFKKLFVHCEPSRLLDTCINNKYKNKIFGKIASKIKSTSSVFRNYFRGDTSYIYAY